MKRLISIILGIFFTLVLATSSMAAWTLTPSLVSKAGNYVYWKVVCTSDGAALSATDLMTVSTMPSKLKKDIQGQTLMRMKVSPGTGGVIPNTTINIILSDMEQDALFTKTTISKDAVSSHLLSADIGIFIPTHGLLYLTLNDIGDGGDQVTLYFDTWKEGD